MNFKLVSSYSPTGDQPEAIKKLIAGAVARAPYQVLLGVTGSGKTFSIANVIQNLQKPTLVISHNKTLAAQLYQEFKEYFPGNAVSYFVSYYDYYQPEAYIPSTDTYISKEAQINAEIEKLRLEATSQIVSRRDVVVVASVSAIYNIGSPEEYNRRVIFLQKGQEISQEKVQKLLIGLYYQRSRLELDRGDFRVRGEIVDISLPYGDEIIRLVWEKSRLTHIISRPVFESKETELNKCLIYPSKHYLADETVVKSAFSQIRQELKERLAKLKRANKLLEANRLEQRVNYDLEMIKEMGYVNGIENYSRYFDSRRPGAPPFSLVDFFVNQYGKDFLVVIDESHMTVPQIGGMYRGDLSRKKMLIDFGFRLPSCLDNRPLKDLEFWTRVPQVIFASATPDEWEIGKSDGQVVEQLIRPTGLIDPEVEVRPTDGQIKDLIEEILARKKKGERVLVTTLTKKMAEELSAYLAETVKSISVHYLHADVDTLQRSDILADLRGGKYDVVVGINLLREGLDLPEVSLVAILDADKQGFLRSKTALIQTMGRTARHVDGKVILYADEETLAMKGALREVNRRREVQLRYNQEHNITPQSIKKPIRERIVALKEELKVDESSLTPGEAKKLIPKLNRRMREYAKILDFEKAAQVRDRIEALKKDFRLAK